MGKGKRNKQKRRDIKIAMPKVVQATKKQLKADSVHILNKMPLKKRLQIAWKVLRGKV